MKKFVARFLIIAGVIIVAFLLFVNYATYSEGTRAGQVIKVSKKGIVFKTWEGQLNMQSFGAVKSDNSLAEVFTFSVKKGNDEVYNMLEAVALTGERVNLHYEEKFATLPWMGDSKFFIVKIDRLPDAEPKNDSPDPLRDGR